MSNSFPLAGLLRLRKLQEDQAAAALSSARGRAEEVRSRSRRLRDSLNSDSSTGLRASGDAHSVEHLVAIAAARASTSSMLSELEALGRSTADEEARTLADHQEARRRALTLEKLEAGHEAAEAAERNVEEQKALDELAVRGLGPSTGLRTSPSTGLSRSGGEAQR
jgi:flagellar FliJ protein